MKADSEISFTMSDEEIEKIKNILTQGGLRHYLLKITDNEELDVVEYSEYQKLEQENADLKKQLHDASIQIQEIIEQDIECPSNCSKIEELKNQQKEFIDYLKDEIKHLEHSRYVSFNKFGEYKLMFYREILSKYKEIIGENYE